MNEQYRTHTCGELREEHIGQRAMLSGWAAAMRNHGGVLFIDLRDHYGVTQVVLHDEALLKGISRETVVRVEGAVVARDAETYNPKLATGTVEVQAETLEALGSPALPLPFEIGTAETREEVRLGYRYLDLRGAHMQRNLKFRAALIRAMRAKMEAMGFLDVQTPILSASSPEGARDYLVPSRRHKGKFYALPQAPQIFKQLLMLSGVDRYYQFAPCFRDEDARNDRHPGEFYQIDFEMSFASQEDVLCVAETLMRALCEEFAPAGSTITPAPFPRIPYKEAMLRYGSDKPDLRNPLIIRNLTGFFAGVGFKPFTGRPVRGINVPGCGLQSKRFFDEMLTFALSIGMQGLGYISVMEDGELKGPIVKFLNEEKQRELLEIFGMRRTDTVFFICDRPQVCDKLAGQIRCELGQRLGLIDKTRFEFCFVTDFPMYELDENRRPAFTHNPFSMPQGGLAALETRDPLEILAWQYDLVLNGSEISSGAVRNHMPEVMAKAFAIAGYSEEELQKRFGALYTAFRYGAPPHAGMGLGFERILMLLLGEESIRDVLAFPLNGSAQDTMLGAPGEVTEQQLRETHIRLRQ